jgi:lipid-A-disaccharide synthase-like uncharacterized protein
MHALAFSAATTEWPQGFTQWCWVTVGLAGQAVFGLRFFYQWLHSEKHGESRIPVSFWWLSVAGTIMSAAYFVYRQQWIALLGNGPQLVPYVRNLMLIYKKQREDEAALLAPQRA